MSTEYCRIVPKELIIFLSTFRFNPLNHKWFCLLCNTWLLIKSINAFKRLSHLWSTSNWNNNRTVTVNRYKCCWIINSELSQSRKNISLISPKFPSGSFQETNLRGYMAQEVNLSICIKRFISGDSDLQTLIWNIKRDGLYIIIWG